METQQWIQTLDAHLHFDPSAEIDRICALIRGEVKRRGVRGVVIGLSGGLDSTTCAYLCVRCLPADQIHLISLPERDSSAATQNHARSVAQALGLPLEEKNLSDLFAELGLYENAPYNVANNRPLLERTIRLLRVLSGAPSFYPWAQEYAFSRRHGILGWLLRRRWWRYAGMTETFIFGKVRTRMVLLSLQAMQQDCLLICTTDRSEYAIGFYDPHGDGVGDIAPLRHLYKTQIRELARALGVAEEILRQPSSGDLAAGLPNETAMGLRYEQLDRILVGLSLGMEDEMVAQVTGIKHATVRAIRSACIIADARRHTPMEVNQ